MRKKTIIGSVLGAAAAAAVIAGIAIPATANADGNTTGAITPAVSSDGHSFYTDEQIDAAWQQATADFPDALPAGVTFPRTAPAFFHPGDGKKHRFETGLPDEIAAKYWRCAWLGQATTSTKMRTLSTTRTKAIASNLTAAKWEALPEVAENQDVPKYLAAMQAYADRHNMDARTAEFQLDCSVYTGE